MQSISKAVCFDCIEVHVENISGYCDLMVKIFQRVRDKVIGEIGTSIYVSNDDINIEVIKKKTSAKIEFSGFCKPCLRMENAKEFIESELYLKIENTIVNPDGNCYFFVDHEGITWHVKDYLIRDRFINW